MMEKSVRSHGRLFAAEFEWHTMKIARLKKKYTQSENKRKSEKQSKKNSNGIIAQRVMQE